MTKAAGLAVAMFAIGVTAADYDNDGWKDLYVTAIGGNHLFRNLGNGTFADVTAKTGTKGPGTFGTSAMFFDYDKDGNLDIVVANYVTWTVEKDLFCTLDGKTKSYCTPESYKGESPTLFRNRGDGTFEDATRKAGLWDPTSKALGVALIDHDDDGWPDFVLANDTQPNKLYRNNHDGTFTDVGTTAGIAFGETGVARAGMGVDSADYSDVGPREPAHRQLLERDDRPLPQRGQRPLRGRGPGLDRRPGEHAHPRLRDLLLRLRPRRPASTSSPATATWPTTSPRCSRA